MGWLFSRYLSRAATLRRALRGQWLGVAIGLLALFVALGGPAAARSTVARITGRQIKDHTITKRDIAPKTLARLHGAQGPPGPAGAPDTPAQVLAKLSAVDGPGSGLDADSIDGSDGAGGDLSGPLSNLQIRAGAIGPDDIATGGVGLNELLSGGTVSDPFLSLIDVPAQSCQSFLFASPAADRGELAIASPQQDLGVGLYMEPGVVGHDGEYPLVLCNGASAQKTLSQAFFDITLVGGP